MFLTSYIVLGLRVIVAFTAIIRDFLSNFYLAPNDRPYTEQQIY